MSRMFYSDFVNRCLRFYARYQNPKFKSEADRRNWEACDSVLNGFSDNDREMLLMIYRNGDTISDNVYQIAKSLGIKQDSIWKLISELERRVAEQRGLL